MQTTQRRVINTHGMDYTALRNGVQWLVDTAGATGCGAIVFRRHAQAASLKSIMPQPLADTLLVDGVVEIKEGPSIQLFDEQSLPETAYRHPMLVVWADEVLMTEIDRIHPTDICAIPWESTDLESWQHGWDMPSAS